MNHDEIRLTGIEAFGFHGVLESERSQGQTFFVDVALSLDLAAAGKSDDLAATVDYSDVAQRIHDLITGPAFDLIETLAERIAELCLSYSLVREVEVTVHKPSAPIAVAFKNVAVVVRRGR